MLHSITVKDYMSGAMAILKPDMDVLDAIHLLLREDISGAPVFDNLGNMIGYLSEKDCMMVALQSSYLEEMGGKVEQFMTKGAITVEVDASIVEVAEMFLKSGHKAYPVMNDNRLVGTISRRDVLKALESLW